MYCRLFDFMWIHLKLIIMYSLNDFKEEFDKLKEENENLKSKLR